MLEAAKQRSFWEKVNTDPLYKPLLCNLQEQYEEMGKGPIEELKFSDLKRYYDSGSRVEQEAGFFARRHRLCVLAMRYLISLRQDKQCLEDLQDVIWAICGEYNWDNSAHLPRDYYQAGQIIALSSAETSLALCEILDILGDDIDPLIRQRVHAQVEERIIKPYLNNYYWWDTCENNWAAVCAGSVGLVFMYHSPDRFPLVQDRLLQAMDNFLRGLSDDGACTEGLGYWGYGFSYFVFFADALKRFTDGKIDLFQNEKVRKVASFQHKAFLQGTAVACFADAGLSGQYSIGLTHYLYTVYPDDVLIPQGQTLDRKGGIRWSMCIRNFLWLNEQALQAVEPPHQSYYLEHAQWLIVKHPSFAFAAKGGHNEEPHNHNDVGTFVLARNGKVLMGDLGIGEYTRFYFNPDYRYDILVNSSRGHSVPIINGQYQKDGKEFASSVQTANNSTLELECAKAYDDKTLRSFVRRYEVTPHGFVLTDKFLFSQQPKSVVSRIIFLEPPALQDGRVGADGVWVQFDTARLDCVLSQEAFSGSQKVERMAYFVDFVAKEHTLTTDMTIGLEVVVEQ